MVHDAWCMMYGLPLGGFLSSLVLWESSLGSRLRSTCISYNRGGSTLLSLVYFGSEVCRHELIRYSPGHRPSFILGPTPPMKFADPVYSYQQRRPFDTGSHLAPSSRQDRVACIWQAVRWRGWLSHLSETQKVSGRRRSKSRGLDHDSWLFFSNTSQPSGLSKPWRTITTSHISRPPDTGVNSMFNL